MMMEKQNDKKSELADQSLSPEEARGKISVKGRKCMKNKGTTEVITQITIDFASSCNSLLTNSDHFVKDRPQDNRRRTGGK